MGQPCDSRMTKGELAGIESAARKTPAKCQAMSSEIATRINSAGRSPRFDAPGSRRGASGRGFCSGGVGGPVGFTGAPTIVWATLSAVNSGEKRATVAYIGRLPRSPGILAIGR